MTPDSSPPSPPVTDAIADAWSDWPHAYSQSDPDVDVCDLCGREYRSHP